MIHNKQLYDFIIFGAKSDLAKRKLFPALYRLEKKREILPGCRIIGVGRVDWDTKQYINDVKKYLELFLTEKINKDIWKIFKNRIIFCSFDINQINHFNRLKKIIDQKNNLLIYYLAISSDIFIKVCQGLKKYKLNQYHARIILEKPIGNSLKTFNYINNNIKKSFTEKQIFRIDHYLGKDMILNILSLRFANPFFSNFWNNKFIDHIQITLAEEIGMEGRGDYYDKTGQIKDMVQNHILQIISILTMSKPISFHESHIHAEKIKILKKIEKIHEKNIINFLIFGQYKKGIYNNNTVCSYLDEKNINQKSKTETFALIKIHINNKIWKGVPFYIRTGKRMPKKCSKIVIFFKKENNFLFKKNNLPSFLGNTLTINLQPNEGLILNIYNKIPSLSSTYDLTSKTLSLDYKKSFKNFEITDAYDKLLLEIIKGKKLLFIHQDEIKYAWKWTDLITSAIKKHPSLLKYYSAGTWGPKEIEMLMEKDNKKWDNS